MRKADLNLVFFMFFVSGFCGLLYQVVWTRMAMASFGVITPVLSVVISAFMLGLSLGSWLGGKWISALVKKFSVPAIVYYAAAELVIGLGAFAVPAAFGVGERVLLEIGPGNSARYLGLSALVLCIAILPWCFFMGATFPLVMQFLRDRAALPSKSFSFLYVANVCGAVAGTLATAFILIEALGFRHTLWVAAAGNFIIAGLALRLGLAPSKGAAPGNSSPLDETRDFQKTDFAGSHGNRFILLILFTTGFVSMAMEVVWIRAFGPVLKTQVYSFALVVAIYLGATLFGSYAYRRHLRAKRIWPIARLLGLLSVAAFLPILINDPRLVVANWTVDIDAVSAIVLLASICPFCALLGYLTPGVIDEYGAGTPSGAGRAYAFNVLGCILGPLFASYLILPGMGERYALVILSFLLLLLYLFARGTVTPRERMWMETGILAVLGSVFLFSRSYEEQVRKVEKHSEVRRDYAASVISFGEERGKHLVVNGVGVTSLTPITKFMVHMPLAFHQGEPRSALIICFGMGTSYRAALSWGIKTTTVELVPSVLQAFEFYHADAARFRNDPNGRMVADDGRRYLKRTGDKFDLIVIDPPPPQEAAGSSLLYSQEFYELAKLHLAENGILQAWLPGGEVATSHAMLRSIRDSFPYVRCFGSVEGWGNHVLASMQPIPARTLPELIARMPVAAQKDFVEWSGGQDATNYLRQVISQELPIESVLDPDLKIRITDDKPFNEYFLLRKWSPF